MSLLQSTTNMGSSLQHSTVRRLAARGRIDLAKARNQATTEEMMGPARARHPKIEPDSNRRRLLQKIVKLSKGTVAACCEPPV